jgi:small subunit ribosomal protein S1
LQFLCNLPLSLTMLITLDLQVKFLDVDEDAGKLVVSQKRAAMEGASFDFKKGAVVSGTITGLRNYGAFLELEGGMAGLLHISQISQDRVENLENLFKIGQKCKVMILEHDKANGRVALSTKALEPTPGDMMKDMEAVFAKADATAIIFHQRIENERLAREAAAKEIVAGLGGALNSSDNAGTNQSIESILESIVNDANDQ